MAHQPVIDPAIYTLLRSQEVTVEVPMDSEKDSAHSSIGALLSDFYSCPLFRNLNHRSMRRLVRNWIDLTLDQITNEGFIVCVKRWSKLGGIFLNCFSWEDDGNLTYEISPELVSSPIFWVIKRLEGLPFNSNRRLYADYVKWIYNWHIFLAKIPLDRPDLEDSAVTAWITRQSEVKNDFGSFEEFLPALRLITSWLYDLDIVDIELQGSHGPGSTASGDKTVPDKERNFYPSVQSIAVVNRNDSRIPCIILEHPDHALLRMVKKDIGNLRPITMETVPMQHSQQALKRVLYRDIDKGYVLAGNFIKFSDQRPSQMAAIRGSRFSNSPTKEDTTDLQAASDLLSVRLVDEMFSGSLREKLLLARTPTVKTPYGVTEVKMYAGMGSATTFPVQTLIFTAFAILSTVITVYQKEFGYFPNPVEAVQEYLTQDIRKSSIYRYLRSIRIYGDDIITPQIATPFLHQLLDGFGLRVNKDKSFIGHKAVREACGTFAFAGYDITPVRYRALPFSGLADFATFDSYRSLINQCFCHGKTVLYRYLLRYFRTIKPFINSREERRRHLHLPKRAGVRISQSYELSDAAILFEEFRGDNADYIGVISTRGTSTYPQRIFGEIRMCLTAYAPKVVNVDANCEEYYLNEALFQGFFGDELPRAHGRVLRGVRLVKRVAYLREFGDRTGWAWAPGCVK